MRNGFDTSQLQEFERDLLTLARQQLPRETKKFLKKTTSKLTKKTKNKAEASIYEDKSGRYVRSIKTGKVYKFGENKLACRSYSTYPTSHLLEFGHQQVVGGKLGQGGRVVGFVLGTRAFEKSAREYEGDYYSDCQNFISQVVEDGLL